MFILFLGFVPLLVCAAEEGEILDPVPNITFIQATVDDSTGGNNNAILEPGETAKIAVRVFNMGSATAWQVFG
ncbi:MAG: hypothetical protein A2Y62_10680 [Candidatus Fischerbacteria bacterium RBG_13_37_8]|uniref:CARDB domain-containing protein n=1 Tax=Candidatus Fischerbacteria bacterium RBG_13_37_8 TaxID=1817863 RepID=A0A1F5VTW7_9BACT|nr:MAG: hypothetical protein A2Y62_10680 [Candidatus Fischerbacteria bacterium RBG_13_37_8]